MKKKRKATANSGANNTCTKGFWAFSEPGSIDNQEIDNQVINQMLTLCVGENYILGCSLLKEECTGCMPDATTRVDRLSSYGKVQLAGKFVDYVEDLISINIELDALSKRSMISEHIRPALTDLRNRTNRLVPEINTATSTMFFNLQYDLMENSHEEAEA